MSADGECRREFERWFREKYAPLDGLVPSPGEWNAWQAAWGRAAAVGAEEIMRMVLLNAESPENDLLTEGQRDGMRLAVGLIRTMFEDEALRAGGVAG